MVGIVGYGVAIPRYRIETKLMQRVWPLAGGMPGIKEKSVAGVDEDCVTLAVEASVNAIRHAGIDAGSIGAVYFGTVSSPYTDKSVAMLLADVLDIPNEVIVADFGGSTRAGTMAFLSCADLINCKRAKYG